MKKIVLSLFLAIFFFACQKENPVVTNISLPIEIILDVGSSMKVDVTHSPQNLPAPDYIWHSSDNSIFTIDNHGLIVAVNPGEATLTVKTIELNLLSTSKVTVVPIQTSSIEVSHKNVDLFLGDSIQLIATVQPENRTDKSILWESSNDKVVTVTNNGLVKAIGLGKGIISVTAGTVSVQCEVVVEPIKVTGITLNTTALSVVIGEAQQLIASILPSNATNSRIEWVSSDPTTVYVSAEGKISGLKIGSAVVTAKTEDGGFTTKCAVDIIPVKVTGITLNKTNLKLALGEDKKLSASVYPSNATNKSIIWSSDNPTVVSVDQNGIVTSFSLGNATISAITEDGGFATRCDVAVQPIEYLVTINAKGKSMQQSSTTGVNLTLHSRLTNPTSVPITLLSVIFIDPARNIIEIQSGGAMLVNDGSQYNSFNLHFDIYSVNDSFIQFISNFKVIYQFRFQGKDYQIEKNFEARSWGSI
jgi:uncharacterized protein YjdB